MTRWTVALRLARRDAMRNRGRTLLILFMVALPVMAAVAADTVARPRRVAATGQRSDNADLGGADAKVIDEQQSEHHAVQQDYTAQRRNWGDGPVLPSPDASAILAALPPGSRLALVTRGTAEINAGEETFRVRAMTFDTTDPLLTQVTRAARGRLPTTPNEIAVSPALATAGLEIGSTATLPDGGVRRVVGVLDGLPYPRIDLLGTADALPLQQADDHDGMERLVRREWYVDSPTPVAYAHVSKLNAIGLAAISGYVRAHPPAGEPRRQDAHGQVWLAAVIGLASAMTLLEIVLLAGPAFAVGARRQRRALAQLAVAGGEPSDARRVVLAGALIIGGLAAAVGTAAGLALAGSAPRVLELLRHSHLDRYVASGRNIAIIAAAAVVSAVIAALFPAISAGRQDPLAVLTDRRDPPRAGRAPLLAALILLALGLAAAVHTARRGDELTVAFAAVPTVLGAVLLAPSAVSVLGKLAGRMPLPLRFAARDASRNRARTAPAIGAVIAVVAGAVALGTGTASDAAENSALYGSATRHRPAAISSDLPADPATWTRVATAARRLVPGQQVYEVRGLAGGVMSSQQVSVCTPQDAGAPYCRGVLQGYSTGYGTSILVGEQGLDVVAGYGSVAERVAAQSVLQAGGMAVFSNRRVAADDLSLRLTRRVDGQESEVLAQVPVQATAIHVDGAAPALAIVSDAAAAKLGIEVVTTGIAISGPVDRHTRALLEDAVALRIPEASVYVEEQGPAKAAGTALLVLGAAAALLVLAGALTATQLALSDARPDFASLHGIGAGPRARRTISAAYAGLITLVGAVLGAAAGLVPGIAVAYPLTRQGIGTGPYIALPWTLLATLVVGVPILAAVVAAATTRSRLPSGTRGLGL